MWPFGSDDSDDGCGHHHFDSGDATTCWPLASATGDWVEGVGPVLKVTVPRRAICQHDGCNKRKRVTEKTKYVAVEDLSRSKSQLRDKHE